MRFARIRERFASTDGSRYDQAVYQTIINYVIAIGQHWRTKKGAMRSGDYFVSGATAGWEALLHAPFEEETLRMIEQAEDARFGVPADVGRYDVVFDGAATAKLANLQLGLSTELDRAMGYLANRDGTSYLNDPLEMLGTYKVGSPALTLTANRSMPKGAATVKWDDEGVEPDDFTLVKDGILTDFQTTRESAGWLKDYYAKAGKPLRSHGGATRHRWMASAPQQGPHNLVLAPAKDDTSFAALCAGVKKGLAVYSGRSKSDQQMLNVETGGDLVYEINNGKLGKVVEGAVLLTRAPDLWKNLLAVGGASTVRTFSSSGTRSEVTSYPRSWNRPTR